MTVTTDPGVDFWLDYIAAEGGLHERIGAATLVVLPEVLQERHRQDAEMTVTADPDVAREDRAMLMTIGHPLLTAAAENVLGEGDVGIVRLPRPTARTPDLAQLQDWARERIPVDHGRVDLTGGPRPSVRHLIRVSALATFAMSSDDRFQEQIECWVDVPTGQPVVDGVDLRLADLVTVEHAERDQLDPDLPGLAGALVALDAEIGRRAEARRRTLGDSVAPTYRAETERARDYYEQMALSLRKRMTAAPPDKVAGYQARLEHCHAERDRRLAEIEEKYRSSAQCLPFRLHLVGVPSLQVEAGIRRGNRWYPVDLEWLSPVRRFAPVVCPACRSDEILVAGKDGLGCRACRPARALESVPDPATPRRPSAPTPPADAPAVGELEEAGPPKVTARPKPAAPERPRVRIHPIKPPSVAAMKRTGSKLMIQLWERVSNGDRGVAAMCAPDGPAAALLRVYGSAGPQVALELADRVQLLNVASSPSAPVPNTDFWLTTGRLGASDRSDHPFQVLWHQSNGRPLIDEIVGVANGIWPWLPWHRFGTSAGLWAAPLGPHEAAASRDDPVAGLVLGTTVERQGIAVAARCLAAWWRLDPQVATTLTERAGPETVAAALDKLVSRRSSTARRGDVEVAAEYGVDQAAVKSMATRLQRRLSLGPTQPW